MSIKGVLFENFKAVFILTGDGDELKRVPVDDFFYSYEEQTFFTKLELLHEDRKMDVPCDYDENTKGEAVGYDGDHPEDDLDNQSELGSVENFLDRREEDELSIHETSLDKALEDAEKEFRKRNRTAREEKIRQKVTAEIRAELEQQYREKLDYYEKRDMYRKKTMLDSEDEE